MQLAWSPGMGKNTVTAGIISSNWSAGFGVDKIFGAYTKKTPTVDIALEDYGLLYRLTESGDKPRISVHTESKERGVVPAFNTIAEIRGSEKPDEYVILSAHFDSWDGGTGATDNGTGRVASLAGQGFLQAYEYLSRWLTPLPTWIRDTIETHFPGTPGGGGSDFASFVAAGAPAFSLSSRSWSYFAYTWHTNRDTYDKIIFDDLRNNAILVAALAYMASEDPVRTSREKSVLPLNLKTGVQMQWPQQVSPTRKGGMD